MTTTLQKTSRREAREGYVRFLLARAGISEDSAEHYLTMSQEVLEGRSLIEMIYTGDSARAVSVVERFVDDTDLEEFE